MPNAFSIIRTGYEGDNGPVFAIANVFGLYTPKYVRSSDYHADITFTLPNFIWSNPTGKLTLDNYKYFKDHYFKSIFGPEDIRNFLAFYNREGIDILDYLMKHVGRFLTLYKKSSAVTLNKFKEIIDLRV